MGCIKLDILENRYKTPELKIVYAKKELTSKKSSSEGRNYYHARYYDPKVSVFYGIDRFTEKYPYQSGYTYAGNKPVEFIEVNGDSTVVSNTGGILFTDDRKGKGDGQVYLQNDEEIKKIGEIGGVIDANTIYSNTLNENMEEAKGIYNPFYF